MPRHENQAQGFFEFAAPINALAIAGAPLRYADVLPERLLFDHSSEAFSDFVPHHIEWQPLARNAMIDSHDVEAVTGLDQLSQQTGWSQPKQRLLELRHRVAMADLPQIAPVLTRGAVGHLGGHGREALRVPQQFVQRLLRTRTNFGDAHRRRHLEQNVTGMHQVAALEIPRMCIVVAPAFFLLWSRRHDLTCEQFLDCLFGGCFFGRHLIQKADRDRPLPEQLACGAEFAGRFPTRCYLNAIDRNAHDRIGSFARVCGVRTIW